MKRFPPHALAGIARERACEMLIIWMQDGNQRHCVAYGITAEHQAAADYVARLLRSRHLTPRKPHEQTYNGRQMARRKTRRLV